MIYSAWHKDFLPVKDEMIKEQALPYFEYKDRTVRWKIIDDGLWFIVNDIYNALGINKGKENREIAEDEKTFIVIYTKSGNRQYKAINEKGLMRILSKTKKPEAEKFVMWVHNTVSPQIRQTGTFVPKQEEKILYLLDI